MKILLIATRMGTKMGIGGVETLIFRMVKFLSANGHQVEIFLTRTTNNAIENELKKYAKIYTGNRIISNHFKFKKMKKNYYDYIYTFNFYSLLFSLYIKQTYFPNCTLCFGVYHPLEYCWLSKANAYARKICGEIMNHFPQENIFYMNDGVRRQHSLNLNKNFSTSPLIPIGVDLDKFNNIKRTPKRYKIVSIGRITDFKTYNFTMVDVISELNNVGYAFEYHIYGDGELLSKLKQYILAKKAESYIFTHGEIPYEDFSRVLTDAWLFIGVGTALIEAAACQVPCLQAIDSDQNAESYGFFNELTDFDLGETNPAKPRYKIADLIAILHQTQDATYQDICLDSYRRAKQFSMPIIMPQFIKALEEAENSNFIFPNHKIISTLTNICFWLFCKKLKFPTPFDFRHLTTQTQPNDCI